MSVISYVVVIVFVSSIAIDCVAMYGGGTVAVQHARRARLDSVAPRMNGGQNGVPHNYDNFVKAIKKNKLSDAIRFLSQDQRLLNAQDPVTRRTPLINAVLAKKPQMVQFLLQQQGINMQAKDESGRDALGWAKQMNYTKIKRQIETKLQRIQKGLTY